MKFFKKIKFLFLLLMSQYILIESSSVKAQRVGPDIARSLLDDARCVTSSSGYGSFLKTKLDISINRIVHSSLFVLKALNGHHVTMACKIEDSQVSVLKLKMGVLDDHLNRKVQMTVNVYQSGSIIESFKDISSGSQLIRVGIDLNRKDVAHPKNIAVEAICQVQLYECELHFVEAKLYSNSK